jgi:uncharacterized protein (DUF736 family)
MEKINFTIWPNKFKKEEKHPDYEIKIKLDQPDTYTKKDGTEGTANSRKVGACWKKEGPSGDKYLSCVVEKDKLSQKQEVSKTGISNSEF